MALKATADPDTRIITLTEAPVAEFASINVVDDIYEGMKDDWATDNTLNKLRFPFTSFGPPLGNQQIGPYVFIRNNDGWRMRPFDGDQELSVIGNLVGIAGFPVWLKRAGRTINIREQLSAQTITVATGTGLDATQAAQLRELHLFYGLELGSTLVVTPSSRAAGTISQTISGDGETSSSVARDP